MNFTRKKLKPRRNKKKKVKNCAIKKRNEINNLDPPNPKQRDAARNENTRSRMDFFSRK